MCQRFLSPLWGWRMKETKNKHSMFIYKQELSFMTTALDKQQFHTDMKWPRNWRVDTRQTSANYHILNTCKCLIYMHITNQEMGFDSNKV